MKKQLIVTPESIIEQMLFLASALEKTDCMTGISQTEIISGIKADLAKLKRLAAKEKYQRVLTHNRKLNCGDLYGTVR